MKVVRILVVFFVVAILAGCLGCSRKTPPKKELAAFKTFESLSEDTKAILRKKDGDLSGVTYCTKSSGDKNTDKYAGDKVADCAEELTIDHRARTGDRETADITIVPYAIYYETNVPVETGVTIRDRRTGNLLAHGSDAGCCAHQAARTFSMNRKLVALNARKL